MSATDELRRLLDERGVEYTDAEDAHTQHTWWSDGDHEIAACNSGERLAVYNLTPEQAVEATLGSDLKAENDKLRELVRDFYPFVSSRAAKPWLAVRLDRMHELGVDV